jgi:hypothetical protein
MRLKFLSFSNLTLLVALSLSSVAAWYSIIGLTAIFAGAVIPVIIMGSILEVGKITTTVWLRKYWHRASWVLKLYLVPAVIALALLTSMGIFGFLSKAHMDQGMISGDVIAKIAIYDEKIKTEKENIESNRKALKQMDEGVDQVLGRSTTETGADKAVALRKSQQKERSRLQNEILQSQKSIAELNEARAPIAAEVRKVEAEVGPIKYIAALIYGDNTDTNMLEAAVRWVIILLVIVFDPLAIALVLAANASKEWDNEEPEESHKPDAWVADVGEKPTVEEIAEPMYEPDDGPLTEEQIEQIKESVDPAPAGWMFDKSSIIKDEPEKSLAELHPYLNQPFSHFTDTKPMVAKSEVAEKVIKPKKKRVKKEPKVIVEPEPVVESIELPGDYITIPEDTHTMQVKQDLPFEELPGGYVSYEGKHMQRGALFSMHPEFLKLSVDASKPVNSGFGSKFPENASKGDVFTRVDVLPNKVYKFDGKNWITINKETSNTYLYNTKYLEYLIEQLKNGQYDPDLLSENERSQIEDYIKINKLNQNN